MNYTISGLLSFLVAFQLFFVAIYLFTHNKGNKRNNRLLGTVFLLFSISLGDLILRVTGVEMPFAALYLVDDGFFFLYGPLLYFYVQGVVYSDFKFKYKHCIHLALYAFYMGFLVYLIILLEPEDQNQIAAQIYTADLPDWMFVVGLLIHVNILIYLWFSWRTVSIYRSIIKDKFSSIDGINLGWLNFMIRAFTGVVIIALIHNIIPVLGNIYFHYSSLIALLIFSFFFINRVLMKALNQPEIFSGIAMNELTKYSGSNLQQEEVSINKTRLIQLMSIEKLFLNPDLSIKELADKMDISTKILSQVINQGFSQNFFDFVNTYRCEEVKNILLSPDDKVTILEALYQGGFNSKSSFNKEFKKLTGQTPTEFKKSIVK